MRKWLYFLVVTSIICTQCGDTTIVGSELFQDENINLETIDTLELRAQTNLLDSVNLFTLQGSNASTFLMGVIDDPLFGEVSSSFVTEVHYSVDPMNLLELVPDYQDEDVLDSMVLVLELDSFAFYGIRDDLFDFDIFLLDQSINEFIDISTNDVIEFGDTPVTSVQDVSIPTDSTIVFFPSLGTSVREFAQLRIPLKKTLAILYLMNSEVLVLGLFSSMSFLGFA